MLAARTGQVGRRCGRAFAGALATGWHRGQRVADLRQAMTAAVGVLPAHRFVIAQLGVELGAVQTDRTKLDQPQPQPPVTWKGSSTSVNSAASSLRKRLRESAMVRWSGWVVGADLAERDRVVRCLRELVAGEHPGGVGVEQKAHRHRRVVGARAAAGVSANRMAEIELVDDREHKQR